MEEDEAVGFGEVAGGIRVVEGIDDAFGVGHEAEDAAGGVADSGDGVGGAVGEGGEGGGGIAGGVDVLEGDLVVLFEDFENIGGFGDEAAFAVGDGEIEDGAEGRKPFAEFGGDADAGPAVFVSAGGVVGEGGGVPVVGIDTGVGPGRRPDLTRI